MSEFFIINGRVVVASYEIARAHMSSRLDGADGSVTRCESVVERAGDVWQVTCQRNKEGTSIVADAVIFAEKSLTDALEAASNWHGNCHAL